VFGTHSLAIRMPRNVICGSGANYIGQTGNDAGNQVQTFNCTTGDLGVGMEEITSTLFTAFPNPVSGMLNIRLADSYSGPASYRIYSTTGQLVDQGFITENPALIDFGLLGKGVYLLGIESADAVHYERVVVH
jgi:hypothetical protein